MYMTGFNSFMDVLPYLCGGQAKVCIDDKIPVDDGWNRNEIRCFQKKSGIHFSLTIPRPPANEVLGKIMVLHVCDSSHGEGGVYPIACWDTNPPGHTHAPGQTLPL